MRVFQALSHVSLFLQCRSSLPTYLRQQAPSGMMAAVETTTANSATVVGGSKGSSSSAAPKVVKQGWLHKRGEHFRNWRPRYFILKDDGQFLGFRNKPSLDTDLTDPLNNFTVRNCEIIESNRPKPFTFAIRGLQMTTVVVRTFYVDSDEERSVTP